MSKRIVGSTPKVDGFRMPGEFEKQEQIGHGEMIIGV